MSRVHRVRVRVHGHIGVGHVVDHEPDIGWHLARDDIRRRHSAPALDETTGKIASYADSDLDERLVLREHVDDALDP